MHYTSQNKIISINELWQFFNRSANLFCITGGDGFLKQVNPHVVDLLGFTEQQLLSLPYMHFIHPQDRQYSAEQSAIVRSQSKMVQYRNRILTSKGNYRWISWTATFIADDNNVYLIGQDYTETHIMEEKLKEEKLNRHKNVLEATLMGQEKERAEIGKELHDNINQMLATVVLYNEMALTEKDQSEEMIRKGNDIVKQTINEIRYLSKSLVGPDMRQIGLSDGIKELIETIQMSTGIKVRFAKSGSIELLPSKVKLTIFRIIQEQTNNIIKHARASRVIIELNKYKDSLSLLVKDNGVGFDMNKRRNGIGLNNIQSRVDIYNGKVLIESSPGKGCAVRVDIPEFMLEPSGQSPD